MNKTNIKEFWYNLSDKLRFLLIGGLNFSISYLIYAIGIFVLGETLYQLALATAWILSSIISFANQRIFVFPVKGNLFKQYLKCCITWFFSYLINAYLLELLVQNIHLNVYIGQIIAVSVAAVFTYLMFKLFAFKH